ncbi:MAG: hypothetical protein B6244_01585 [Candidatus Cloacimonetes bacterium 4572_55]|nr:MAG: hypothetical protein B6244_01585 [Candidatus Cloacimonetes bacterium 4572_55]
MNLTPRIGRIGLMHGKETEFPEAVIERINRKNGDQIQAESIKIGDIPLDYECNYRLIIDRISYKVPYYQSFLKSMILGGIYVINDPFWFDTSDRFFNFGLISRLNIPTPKTVCLPSHSYGDQVSNKDLTNMIFPLDWDRVINYTKFPAILKPYNDIGWQNEITVQSKEELLYHYNQSGTATMIVQELIQYEFFVRCFVIGKKHVLPIIYDPKNRSFSSDAAPLPIELELRLKSKSQRICQALGYDMNTVDFAVTGDKICAVDFMNPVPAVRSEGVGDQNFDWVVGHLADLAIDLAKREASSYDNHHWYRVEKLPKKPRLRQSIKS